MGDGARRRRVVVWSLAAALVLLAAGASVVLRTSTEAGSARDAPDPRERGRSTDALTAAGP